MSSEAFWACRRIIVTGGAGFLGTRVVDRLRVLGCVDVVVPRSRNTDLRVMSEVEGLLHDVRPDMIIHLAAVVGGIGANRDNPGSFFYDNLIMGVQLIEAARIRGVGKFVSVGTICAYPKHTPVPFREESLWDGYPEETNAAYGLAKKMLLVQSQAYRQQYGMNAIYLLPTNLYGPDDNFDPDTSHVIPAIIRKCCLARENGNNEVDLWGDGSATREFLYVDDAAEAVVAAAESYDSSEPVNVGSGVEVTIEELAITIARLVGYSGSIQWDRSKPNGQPRRRLDVSRARERFGFEAHTTLEVGLRKVIDRYEEDRNLSYGC